MDYRRVGCQISIIFFALFFGMALPAHAGRSYGKHSGYLETTQGERETKIEDLIIVPPPPPKGLSLTERIFNDELNKEFKDRYEEKFGRTEAERAYQAPNRFTYYNDIYGFRGTPQENYDERKRFGEYMTRRLSEFHVDNYLKNDPKARPVYEMKERLSNINVQVYEYRFDMSYSLSANTFDMKVVNPYFPTARLRLQMDTGAFGPGSVDEMIVTMGRPVTQTISFETNYFLQNGILAATAYKSITAALGTYVTTSTFTKDKGNTPRESLYLAGLGYVF